jgi:hypothetical protein
MPLVLLLMQLCFERWKNNDLIFMHQLYKVGVDVKKQSCIQSCYDTQIRGPQFTSPYEYHPRL